MRYPEHLPNAPITEALFDIRVKANPDFSPAEFVNLKSKLASTFPKMEEARAGKFTLQLRPDQPPNPEVSDFGIQGYFFKAEDEKLIAQFRIDGFTLNKLRPYTSWDELFPVVIDLWREYVSAAKPIAVTRLAVRYINQIAINREVSKNGAGSSVDFVTFSKYLVALPQVPAELPQKTSDFIYRVTLPLEDSVSAHVSQVYQPAPPPEPLFVILDIDVFEDIEIAPLEPAVVERFGKLRTHKNEIFFNYLTDATIGMFK